MSKFSPEIEEKYSKPTSASEWRKAREVGEVVQLMSGKWIRLRPVSLDRLIMSGKLPDLLTPVAARTLWIETDLETIGEQAELARSYTELVNTIVPLAVMEPKIVENPQEDDEISLDDIEFRDKVAIFQLATQGAEMLKSFREGQISALENISNSENYREPSE